MRNQTKKFTTEPKSYTAMLLYFFLILYCLLVQKKMETEKWPKAADSSLHPSGESGPFTTRMLAEKIKGKRDCMEHVYNESRPYSNYCY